VRQYEENKLSLKETMNLSDQEFKTRMEHCMTTNKKRSRTFEDLEDNMKCLDVTSKMMRTDFGFCISKEKTPHGSIDSMDVNNNNRVLPDARSIDREEEGDSCDEIEVVTGGDLSRNRAESERRDHLTISDENTNQMPFDQNSVSSDPIAQDDNGEDSTMWEEQMEAEAIRSTKKKDISLGEMIQSSKKTDKTRETTDKYRKDAKQDNRRAKKTITKEKPSEKKKKKKSQIEVVL
jgi:hypothetical protein